MGSDGDRLERERDRVLEQHDAIMRRVQEEGAGAALADARQNAVAAESLRDHHDLVLAEALMLLGSLAESVGELEEAEATDRRALDVLLPLEDPGARLQLAMLLGNLAVREDGRLDLVAATTLREQALSSCRGVLPEAHERVGVAVQNLAATWESRGDSLAADRVLAAHVTLAVEQGGDPEQIAASGPFAEALPNVLVRKATQFEREGRLDAAEHFYLMGIASVELRRPDDELTHGNVRSVLASLLERRGRTDEAREILLDVLDRLGVENAQDAGPLGIVTTIALNNLGLLEYHAGDLRSALAFHEAALAARQSRTDDDRALAQSYTNLGLVRGAMGDLPGAWEVTLAAYRLLAHETDPEVVDVINNLGWIARAKGEAATARSLYEDALRRRRHLYGERHPAVAESLNNLGIACLAAGENATARDLLQEGLELRRTIYGPQHPEVVASLVNVANAMMATGDLDQAGAQLNAAWVTHLMLDPETQTPTTNVILFGLAQHALLSDDVQGAVDALDAALDHEYQMTASILGLASERTRMLRLADVRQHGDALISAALDHSPDPAALATRAYQHVLRRKAMGVEFLAIQRAALTAELHADQNELAGELVQARSELRRAVLDRQDLDTVAAHRARVEALEAALAREIQETFPPTGSDEELDEVLRAVPPDAVVVDFVRCGVWNPNGQFGAQWPRHRYVAFVLSGADGSLRMLDLGDATTIDEAIGVYRRDLLRRRPGTGVDASGEASTAGDELRRLVLDPLAPLLEGLRRLVIVPDGMLHLVPFTALPWLRGQQLVDVCEVSNLTSAREVRDLARPLHRTASGSPLVVGDPDYELAGEDPEPTVEVGEVADLAARGLPDVEELRAAFGALPGTAAEARAVGAVLGVAPVTGRDADKTNVVNVHRPRVLHLATHAFFLRMHIGVALRGAGDLAGDTTAGPLDDPLLRCALVLAGANRWMRTGELHPRAGDGFLTGLDVLGLDLEGTQLVVLSACDTARGEILDGEGVVGLSRAFTSAGAESLVMSLWQVPDKQTAELMTTFYERLAEGDEIPTALRAAQLGTRARYPNPRDWAAFVCQGRASPLTLS